jgi:hypothetical protein
MTRYTTYIMTMKENPPSYNDLLRIHPVVQFIHRSMVLHIHRDLLARLAVQHGERRSDLYFGVRAHT